MAWASGAGIARWQRNVVVIIFKRPRNDCLENGAALLLWHNKMAAQPYYFFKKGHGTIVWERARPFFSGITRWQRDVVIFVKEHGTTFQEMEP